jgi:hypothetical protein
VMLRSAKRHGQRMVAKTAEDAKQRSAETDAKTAPGTSDGSNGADAPRSEGL